MKYSTYLTLIVFSFATYMIYFFVTYEKVVEFDTTTSGYTPEKVLSSEIPEIPDVSEPETKEIQKEIKEIRKELEATMDIEKKSVEQMRDEVHKILDEITEIDSSVTISFNMTIPNPLNNQ